jgi:hypothetical protein
MDSIAASPNIGGGKMDVRRFHRQPEGQPSHRGNLTPDETSGSHGDRITIGSPLVALPDDDSRLSSRRSSENSANTYKNVMTNHPIWFGGSAVDPLPEPNVGRSGFEPLKT